MSTNVDPKTIEAAKQYVDKQMETMRRYGSAPDDFSEDEYRTSVPIHPSTPCCQFVRTTSSPGLFSHSPPNTTRRKSSM